MGIFNSKSDSSNYNSNYIKKNIIKRYKSFSEIYKILYQITGGNNDCRISQWVNLLITQPIQTYVVVNLKKNEIEGYQEAGNNLTVVINNFKVIFSSSELNFSVNDIDITEEQFRDYITALNNAITARGHGNGIVSKESIKYSHRQLLCILKKDVEKFLKEVSDYAKSYKYSNGFYKLFVNTEWIIDNYNKFVENEIRNFINQIDLKIREIESALEHFQNVSRDIQSEINDAHVQHKSREGVIMSSLGFIFRDYRVKSNLN